MEPSKSKNSQSGSAVVGPNVIMGTGNIICENVIIRDGVVIGNDNYFGPGCIIGDFAEKIGWFNDGGYGKVKIGNGNRFTKQVTIDSGTERDTVVGNDVVMLKGSHLGHDVIVRDGVTISCGVLVGGFCEIGQRSNLGLGAVLHQRLVIPEGVMIGMNTTVTKKSYLMAYGKYAGSPAKYIGDNSSRFNSK